MKRGAERVLSDARALPHPLGAPASGLSHGFAPAGRAGAGLEAWGVRAHEPTDDARRIDWAASARAGTLLVRLHEAETALPNLVLLDARLRAWPRARATAAIATATLALTQLGAGHEVGLLEYGEDPHGTLTAPSSGPRHEARLRARLAPWSEERRAERVPRPSPSGTVAALRVAERALGSRGIVFWVSDFRGEALRAWRSGALSLARRHALVPVWVATPSAADLPATGPVRVLGDGTTAIVDAGRPAIRAALRAEEAGFVTAVERTFAAARTPLLRLRAGEDPVTALASQLRALRGWAA